MSIQIGAYWRKYAKFKPEVCAQGMNKMQLTELEPQFLRREVRRQMGSFHKPGLPCSGAALLPHTDACWEQRMHDAVYLPYVNTIAEAQGVEFLCPKCFIDNKGRVGTHGVLCWSSSRGIPDDAKPGPGRWRLVGTGYHDLSLMEEPGKSRSVLLTGDGCKAHFFVTNGTVTF